MERLEHATIAGVPLHISQAFLAVVLVLGYFAGSQVADTQLVRIPTIDSTEDALRAFEPGGAFETIEMQITPGLGWGFAAGLGVAAIYALSVVAHELGHLLAARRAGIDVASMQLHAAGGYVELEDDDSLTAGKLAAIVAAGPLVTAALTLVAVLLLTSLGWPMAGLPVEGSAAEAAAGRVLSAAFVMNLTGLLINLIPHRALDGGQLLQAARLWRGRTQG